MPRQKKEKTNEASPQAQIEAYLNQNKNDHYNFETEHLYNVSSGSLLLDIKICLLFNPRCRIMCSKSWP